MGVHAFEDEPAYDRLCGSQKTIELRRSVGVAERWNMPVSVWHSHAGWDGGVEVDALPHDYIAICLQGRITCVRGGAVGRYGGPEADVVTLFRAGDPAFYVSNQAARFLHLNFMPELWRCIAQELAGGRGEKIELRPDTVFVADRDLRRMIDTYVGRALSPDAPCSIEMDSYANLIALALLKRHSSLSPGVAVRPFSLTPARLKLVYDFIEAHIAEDLGLSDLSAAAGLSPFHFARAFKEETGQPPHRHLMDRRVSRAQEMLTASEVPLAEIALACGFSSQSHFTTAFKRVLGTTPGAWRRAVMN